MKINNFISFFVFTSNTVESGDNTEILPEELGLAEEIINSNSKIYPHCQVFPLLRLVQSVITVINRNILNMKNSKRKRVG